MSDDNGSGLKLTLENDFLAIGQLLDSTRNGHDDALRRGYEIRAAIGRYFGDDKLHLFDHAGLIKFLDEQGARRAGDLLQRCCNHPNASHELICCACANEPDEPSAATD